MYDTLSMSQNGNENKFYFIYFFQMTTCKMTDRPKTLSEIQRTARCFFVQYPL